MILFRIHNNYIIFFPLFCLLLFSTYPSIDFWIYLTNTHINTHTHRLPWDYISVLRRFTLWILTTHIMGGISPQSISCSLTLSLLPSLSPSLSLYSPHLRFPILRLCSLLLASQVYSTLSKLIRGKICAGKDKKDSPAPLPTLPLFKSLGWWWIADNCF